jgi:hypothetical protein
MFAVDILVYLTFSELHAGRFWLYEKTLSVRANVTLRRCFVLPSFWLVPECGVDFFIFTAAGDDKNIFKVTSREMLVVYAHLHCTCKSFITVLFRASNFLVGL